MPLRFYLDEHVARSVVDGLMLIGVDALMAVDDGYESTDDEIVFERSVELDRLMVTNDEDYLGIADDWRNRGFDFPGLVYFPDQNLDIGVLIEDLFTISFGSFPLEDRGKTQYLPLVKS